MPNSVRVWFAGYLPPSPNITPPIERRPVVRITRYAPDIILEYDNLTATVELVLDRLLEIGVIRGKSEADILVQVGQHRVAEGVIWDDIGKPEEIGTEVVVVYPDLEEPLQSTSPRQ
jgi:hypothetical protein